MVFLPGDHVLDMNITVANISRLAMCGESSSGYVATVACNGAVGFSFSSVADFKTHSLTFTSCGRKYDGSGFTATLLLESIDNVELVNCCFQDSLGRSLTVYDTSITLAENNEFSHGRGGITALDSNLIFIGNTTFIGNDGSAVINVTNCCLSSTGSIHFINNLNTDDHDSYYVAGAIWASTSFLSFNGTSNFINNSYSGGAIYAFNNTLLSFTGTSNFISNGAAAGGAINAFNNIILSFSGTSNFISNSADNGGAIFAYNTIHLSFSGTSNFISNSADSGGAIYAYNTIHLSFKGTSNFTNNLAYIGGGAIDAEDNTSLSFTGTTNFINNSAKSSGGAILAWGDSTINVAGTSNFINNSASQYGGSIYAINNASLSFTGTINFINNSANTGGAISLSDSISLNFTGTSNFINNSALKFLGGGGAISASYKVLLSFTGRSNFINNSATDQNGGGIYLIASSFSVMPNTTLYWENNHAHLGGAIYVEDRSTPFIYCTHIEIRKDKCFFQLPGQNLPSSIDVQFVFKDNSADAGSALYGGAIDNCTLTGLDSYSSGEVFDMLVHIENDSTTSNISSYPFRICPCEGHHSSCSKSNALFTVHPGETFQVSLVAVGQRNGTVPTAVLSHFKDIDANIVSLQWFQYTQEIKSTCTKLNYTVFSVDDVVSLHLYADGPCSTFSDELVLQLSLNTSCPPGFSLSKAERSCVCEQRLKEYTTLCYITDGLGNITRDSLDKFWVGYDHESDGLILHPHCPLDYCVSCTVEFPLNNTDLQCVDHRSGLLCGACRNGYSLVLGTSQCKRCSNNYLALLVPFTLMGIALVFLLLICKLTVATGTLSGLVFYANIVGVNRTLFLPVETTNILSVFIAWLNLDFGIESCFYNGMDAYSKTWLQFVFPVYIWVIVGLLILVSRYSDRFAKLLGNNPVSVLSTLILLSYAKILRTIINAINVTYLEYPTYNKGVWLYDANVNYLGGKHIPLFLVAMFFFLFLFLPYTVLLLFGQWLQAISHRRLFAWVNRLKPFLDSYHAPYKPKHRYWPGLLLVLRFAHLLVLTLNSRQDPSVNLLAIQVGTAMLQLWAWISHGVYRNWCLDALEGSFALNLIILAAATMHINISQGNQLAVGYTSVTIALATFIGILAYHIFQQVRATELWKKIPKMNCNLNFNHAGTRPVDNAEVGDFSQLREPLLDDPPQPNYGAF